jgi:hypothetical protein
MEMSSAAYASLNPTSLDNLKNPLRLPGVDGVMGMLDASNSPVRFTAHKKSIEILPSKRADLLAYGAERDGKTYVNPTFRVQKGKEVSAEFTNDLDEETTVPLARAARRLADGWSSLPAGCSWGRLRLRLPGARPGRDLLVPSTPPWENRYPDLLGTGRLLPS